MSHYAIRPEMVNYLLQNGYNFEPTRYIREGYNLFKQYALGFILFTGLLFGIELIGEVLEEMYGTRLFSRLATLLTLPLYYGYLIVAHKIWQGEKPLFSDFFTFVANVDSYIAVFLLNVYMWSMIILGTCVLILPGIYLFIGYVFAANFLIFGNMELKECLKMSRKLVSKNWFAVFNFFLLYSLVFVAGLLCFGVGLLVAFPISNCAIYAAFADLMQQADANSWQYCGEVETIVDEGF